MIKQRINLEQNYWTVFVDFELFGTIFKVIVLRF